MTITAPSQHDLPAPRSAVRQAAALAIGLTLALRLGLGFAMGIAWAVASPSLSPLVPPGTYGKLPMPVTPLGQALGSVWVRWDSVQHLNLALRGYADMGAGSTVFYPLYAGLTRATSSLTGASVLAAGLAVSTVATAVSLLFLFLIGEHLFGLAAGKWASIALAAYPAAVFLLAPFTESLFLATMLGAFLAAYRRRWLVAALLGALASLTRGPGMAITASLVVLAVQQLTGAAGRQGVRAIAPMLLAIIAPLAGGVAFLAWRASAGYPPMLQVLETYVGTTPVDPITGMLLALRQWVEVHDLPTTLDLLSALVFIGITVAMLVRKRWRRAELVVYMLVSLSVLLARHTVGAASLKSLSRYVLVLFPAYLILGDALAAARPATRFWYVTVSSCLLLVSGVLFALWFFLG